MSEQSPSSSSPHRRSAVEWEQLFDRFLASGLTQKAFCEREHLSYHAFKNRYRLSPKFAGKRRKLSSSKPSSPSAFRAVRAVPSRSCGADGADPVLVRLGERVSFECSAELALEAIARLAREGAA